MDMPSSTDSDDTVRNIETLARQMRLPEAEVGIVYHRALGELAATARIRSFLGILAMSTTRTILAARAPAHRVH